MDFLNTELWEQSKATLFRCFGLGSKIKPKALESLHPTYETSSISIITDFLMLSESDL